MNINFTKKELLKLLVSALVLGLVFGFDDRREIFVLQLWLANFVFMAVLSLIVLVIMLISQKWVAARYNIRAEYDIWGISRFGFREYQKIPESFWMKKLPLGIILPLTIAVFSEGKLWFAGVGRMLTSVQREHRIGRQWKNIADYEEARIAFAGSIATIISLIIFGVLFERTSLELWKTLIFISITVLLSNILPFPQLAGGQMLFNSLYLYVFTLILAAISSLLIVFVPTIPALASALVLAIIGVIAVYFKREV